MKSRETQLSEAISEIKRQQIKALNSARMAAIGEMAQGLAHEINNPLTVVRGTTSILKDQTADEKMVKYYDTILKSSDRIASIVKSLRIFSQSEESANDEFYVSELMETIVELYSARLRVLGIPFEYNPLDKDIKLTIKGNMSQLVQAVVHLLNNAIDASASVSNPVITLNPTISAQTVMIAVKDKGPGVPKEIRHKIMEPFMTTKEAGKGSGLGLSLCKGIATAHNGDVYLDESQTDTCFVLALPVQERTDLAAAA